MRRPGTYFIQIDEDPQRSKGQRRVTELDGFVCAHCGGHTFVPPNVDINEVGGRCSICSDKRDPLKGLVCLPCKAKGKCFPFEEQLRAVEAKKMLFDEIGKR